MNLEDLDLLDFLDHHDISYETHGENIGDGWVGVSPCPDCGDSINHFGINIGNKAISCWVCGLTGTLIKYLMMTMNISYEEAVGLISDHDDTIDQLKDVDIEESVENIFKAKEVKEVMPKKITKYLPTIPGERIDHHLVEEYHLLKHYLSKRKITIGMCKRHRFRFHYESHRIIMPIYSKKGKRVAYQGRDITGRAMLKIITQPKGVKLSEHLHNLNNWHGQSHIIVVEGIIDVVKLEGLLFKHYHKSDFHALGCFTNRPSHEQISLLLGLGYNKLLAMFDGDAWFKYRDIPIDTEPIILSPKKDPASLTDQEFLDLQLDSYL